MTSLKIELISNFILEKLLFSKDEIRMKLIIIENILYSLTARAKALRNYTEYFKLYTNPRKIQNIYEFFIILLDSVIQSFYEQSDQSFYE